MKKGFSIIELLTVIVIIGIIVGMSIPYVNSKQAAFKSDYKNIVDVLNTSRQISITKNDTITVFLDSNKIYNNNGTDTLKFNKNIYLTIPGSTGDSLMFYPNGSVNNSFTLVLHGVSRTDTIVVTLTGYVIHK